jgi:peptidoglycan hydrolase-like protein with peptidoglycan-binding domain
MLTITQLQEALNAAGQRDPDGEPLEVDGEYGPKTEYAFTESLKPASVPADVLRAGDRVRLRKLNTA